MNKHEPIEKKYYLCTFQRYGECANIFDQMLLDFHPIYYVAKNNAVLINHIEVDKEQYDMYLKWGD